MFSVTGLFGAFFMSLFISVGLCRAHFFRSFANEPLDLLQDSNLPILQEKSADAELQLVEMRGERSKPQAHLLIQPSRLSGTARNLHCPWAPEDIRAPAAAPAVAHLPVRSFIPDLPVLAVVSILVHSAAARRFCLRRYQSGPFHTRKTTRAHQIPSQPNNRKDPMEAPTGSPQ